jgi:hypothetical protein
MRRFAARLPLAVLSVVGLGSPAAAAPMWMGVASCSASACHHQGDAKQTKRSEYTTWAAHDKHSRAYYVLFDDRAKTIMRNLLPEKKPAANKEPLCLKCHAMAYTSGTEEPTGPRFSLDDGVGCESCHGPAEKWLGQHYLDGFRTRPVEDKARLGLHDTKGLASRFGICAGCHIGSADREVDHELIASGHPRLSFEFSGHLAKYIKHWPAQEDRDRYPDYDARAWLVGQVAGAKASIELTKARAERAEKDGKANWPEFAEYGCFACHRTLSVLDWKKPASTLKLGDPDRRLGELTWGTWYMALTPSLTGNLATDRPALGCLRQMMRGQGADPKDIAAQATKAVGELDKWLTQLDRGPKRTPPLGMVEREKLLLLLTMPDEKRGRGADWDEAAQIYLGLSALSQQYGGEASADAHLADLRNKLRETAQLLRGAYPSGVDSPSNWNGEAVREFQKQMTELRKLLGH